MSAVAPIHRYLLIYIKIKIAKIFQCQGSTTQGSFLNFYGSCITNCKSGKHFILDILNCLRNRLDYLQTEITRVYFS